MFYSICCINLTAASLVMVDKSAQQRLKTRCSSNTMQQIPFSLSAFHLLTLYITAALDTALQLVIVKWLTLLRCQCQSTAWVWRPRTQRLLYLNSLTLLLLLEPSTHTYTLQTSAQHINRLILLITNTTRLLIINCYSKHMLKLLPHNLTTFSSALHGMKCTKSSIQ